MIFERNLYRKRRTVLMRRLQSMHRIGKHSRATMGTKDDVGVEVEGEVVEEVSASKNPVHQTTIPNYQIRSAQACRQAAEQRFPLHPFRDHLLELATNVKIGEGSLVLAIEGIKDLLLPRRQSPKLRHTLLSSDKRVQNPRDRHQHHHRCGPQLDLCRRATCMALLIQCHLAPLMSHVLQEEHQREHLFRSGRNHRHRRAQAFCHGDFQGHLQSKQTSMMPKLHHANTKSNA